jgi:hypothetical protein
LARIIDAFVRNIERYRSPGRAPSRPLALTRNHQGTLQRSCGRGARRHAEAPRLLCKPSETNRSRTRWVFRPAASANPRRRGVREDAVRRQKNSVRPSGGRWSRIARKIVTPPALKPAASGITSPRTGSSSLPCPRTPHELQVSTIPWRRSLLWSCGPRSG